VSESTEEELAAILASAKAEMQSARFRTLGMVKLLHTDLPRLVGDVRAQSRRIAKLDEQLAARDAQIARLRQVVEHEPQVIT
jgi:hypothetical protein